MKTTTETALKAIIGADDEITTQQAGQILSVLRGELRTPSRLLTMKEAAARFGCTVRTVQRWCKDGELQTIKRGRLVRIPEDSLYTMTTAGGAK
jgi:excisionase family DNA binding protein